MSKAATIKSSMSSSSVSAGLATHPSARVGIIDCGSEPQLNLYGALVHDGFTVHAGSVASEPLISDCDIILIVGQTSADELIRMARSIKHRMSDVILMAIASVDSRHIPACIDAGLDDCIDSRWQQPAIVSKIKSMYRMHSTPRVSGLRLHAGGVMTPVPVRMNKSPIMVYPSRCCVTTNEKDAGLSAFEFKILLTLARNANTIVSRQTIYQAIHNFSPDNTEHRQLDCHIFSIRRKLQSNGNCLQTLRGLGYKLINAQVA
jgi:DNA-binding response OmpR family regulator